MPAGRPPRIIRIIDAVCFVLALVAVALVLLSIVGCAGEPPPEFGTVVEKRYDRAYTTRTPDTWIPQQCTGGYGSVPRTCTGPTFVPGHTDYHPESWNIRVTDGERKVWIDVSEHTYNSSSIGRCYNSREDRIVELGCEERP